MQFIESQTYESYVFIFVLYGKYPKYRRRNNYNKKKTRIENVRNVESSGVKATVKPF